MSLLTDAGLDPTSVELDEPSSLDVELGRDDDLRELLPQRFAELGLFDGGDESMSMSCDVSMKAKSSEPFEPPLKKNRN